MLIVTHMAQQRKRVDNSELDTNHIYDLIWAEFEPHWLSFDVLVEVGL